MTGFSGFGNSPRGRPSLPPDLRRVAQVSVKFSRADFESVCKAAHRDGKLPAEWLRDQALRAAGKR